MSPVLVKLRYERSTRRIDNLTNPTFRQFIKAIAGDKGREAGHNLDAGTDTVNCVKIPIPNTKSGLVLVDTPGFDDPKRDNGEILKVIAKWLKESCVTSTIAPIPSQLTQRF